MKEICVITGGGSGMGLATAHILGKKYKIILVGRTQAKLEKAKAQLLEDGIEAETFAADVGDEASIHRLAAYAAEAGRVKILVHAAGLSPHMGSGADIMQGNALGTVIMDEEFYKVMGEGGCMINISSMSAYIAPRIVMPRRFYRLALTNREKFMNRMMVLINLLPKSQRSNLAYCISKDFVIWYSKRIAGKMGQKGIRVLSITPGNFETPMGRLEEKEAGSFMKYCAIKRFGRPQEIAELIAFCADDKPGFLTGCDIICDGGCIAGKKIK